MKKYVTISFNDFVKQKLHEAKAHKDEQPEKPVDIEDDLQSDPEFDEEEDSNEPIKKEAKDKNKKPKFGSSEYIKELKREFEAIINQYPQ